MPLPMANKTTAASGAGADQSTQGPEEAAGDAPAPKPTVPFVRAALELEDRFLQETTALATSAKPVGPLSVPAAGPYIRSILVVVKASGGAGGTAVANADAPFNVLSSLALEDVNGTNLFGPVSGYSAFLRQKYLPTREYQSDPRSSVVFSDVDSNGDFTFALRIPCELGGRDAMGCLPNQDASSTYKLLYTIAPDSTIYSTSPTTLPNITVSAVLEAYSQPAATDIRGNVQATTPPGLGVTQFTRIEQVPVVSGDNTVRLSRHGNLYRGLIFVIRDNNGDRQDGIFPDPARFSIDSRNMFIRSETYWKNLMSERYGFTAALDVADGLDSGVFVIDYIHDFDGKPGAELRDRYLRTTQASNILLEGSFGANSTNLEIIYNDVSPGSVAV